jgi:hypothetical protein
MTPRTEITRLSDNLLAPKVYVAEIRQHSDGRVDWAIQFVNDAQPTLWRETKSVRTARKAIKAAVRARAKQKGGAK